MPESSPVPRPQRSARSRKNQALVRADTRVSKPAQRRTKPVSQTQLKAYRQQIEFYSITLGYKASKVWEMMETIFNIGATPKQYEGLRNGNPGELRKNLSEDVWYSLAPYVQARADLGLETEVVLDSGRVFESKKVKEYVRRTLYGTRAMLVKKASNSCETYI
ncbi:hypothetical protein ABW19_dt0200419 [Dactylella cylindrospora]|nr:hypothetical protein ABW19_dt0200419 [Dactylella cylindrospora]